MEEKMITDNFKVVILSGVTSGLLTGLLSSCCCCLPILSGVGGCWFYSYMEKRDISSSGAMILAMLGGLISAVPAFLISMLAQVYLEKNMSLLSSEFSELTTLIPPIDFSTGSLLMGFFSTLIINVVFSFIGVGIYLLTRKNKMA